MKTKQESIERSERERSEHTPTPWKQVDTYRILGNDDQCLVGLLGRSGEELFANGKLIVRAVNSYQLMIDALKHARKLAVISLEDMRKEGEQEDGMCISAEKSNYELYDRAIRQAEEGV